MKIPHKSIAEEPTNSEFRAYIYFPSEFLDDQTGFLYGEASFNETDQHIVNVIVTTIKKQVEEGCRLQLLGTWNQQKIRSDDKPPFVWVRIDSESFKSVKLKSVFVGHFSVSLADSTLILYDRDIIKSELLGTNENWIQSKILTNLGRLLSLNAPYKKATDQLQNTKLHDLVFNNSNVILQFHQRFQQWKIWKKSKSEIDYYNLMFMMIFDLIFGMAAFHVFHSVGGTNYIVDTFLTSFKVVNNDSSKMLQILVDLLCTSGYCR